VSTTGRFWASPEAIPVAVGITGLLARLPRLGARAALANALVSTLGLAAAAGLTLPHLLRTHTPAVEQSARNLLHSVPDGAYVLLNEDDTYFATGYVQWALGERQDVTVVSWATMGSSWYVRRVATRGVMGAPGPEPTAVRAVRYLVAQGKPVFVDRTMVDVIRVFPTYPYGVLMKVLPEGTRLPPTEAMLAENQQVFDRFVLDYPQPGPDDEYATLVHERYAWTWWQLAARLEQEGKLERARWAAEAARAIGPASSR
jgi:hypothetical protein